MKRAVKRGLSLLCVCAVWHGAALAQLADPTRPPPEARLTAADLADVPPTPAGPQLQSVLIGSNGRQVAVIDGQTVRKGEKINGAVLVDVRKNQVVLQKGKNKQVLTLFPDDAKNDAKKAAH
ncbi:MSHA biogenesis protein MshK [Duganella callida]|uniref:MSHA biogenesis protein MshK n=2 Tax=Duganella callida TaxID=2561932 RepID=A0A4Y9SFI0_9BURK|nr:MSHA biogenesis protein MshK [Duganella callida]